MYQVIIIVHVLLGLGVIGLVLLQQGKGADAGAAFGSGSSGSVFGAQGASSFLSRTTAILAALFFTTSLGLAVMSGRDGESVDLMDTPVVEEVLEDVPVINGSAGNVPIKAIPMDKADIPAGIIPEQTSGITSVVSDKVGQVTNGIAGKVESGVSGLGSVVSDKVGQVTNGIAGKVESGVSGLGSIVSDKVGQVTSGIADKAGSDPSGISAVISERIKQAKDVVINKIETGQSAVQEIEIMAPTIQE